jgi:superfamily I DNA/RNA helicase
MNKFAPKQSEIIIKLKPTNEQLAIIKEGSKGTNLVIEAFAGSSKTTTCVMIAEANPKQSLYLAFNKSIADEAGRKFSQWVECKTLHSLAWKAIIKYSKSPMGQKLQGNFNLSDINFISPIPIDELIKERLKVTEIIKLFCQSNELDLADFLVNLVEPLQENLAKAVINFWVDCTNPYTSTKITHDVYLKLFQQSLPKLDYEIIYLDELQDSNPITLAIFLDQLQYGTQLIGVGDPFQAIYEWRGAIDAFKLLPETFTKLYLTESFRFTQEIADMAYKLTAIAGNTRKIIGRGKVPNGLIDDKEVIIVRNNSTGLGYILEAANMDKAIYAEMDLTDLWGKLYHISSLMGKQVPKYPNKELTQYQTFRELCDASELIPEVKKLINLTSQLSNRGLTANINRIKSCLVKSEGEADIIITTAHKSKGREYNKVELAYDMFYVKGEETEIEVLLRDQTLNLIYVALTRGKYKVKLPMAILELLANYEELIEEAEAAKFIGLIE